MLNTSVELGVHTIKNSIESWPKSLVNAYAFKLGKFNSVRWPTQRNNFFLTESFKITKVIIRIHKPSLKNVGSSAVGKTFMQKRRRWNIEIAPHLWPSEIKWWEHGVFFIIFICFCIPIFLHRSIRWTGCHYGKWYSYATVRVRCIQQWIFQRHPPKILALARGSCTICVGRQH